MEMNFEGRAKKKKRKEKKATVELEVFVLKTPHKLSQIVY